MSEHDTLLPIGKAAQKLGVSTKTILRWTDSGRLPLGGLSEGGHRRYRLADLERIQSERQQRAA